MLDRGRVVPRDSIDVEQDFIIIVHLVQPNPQDSGKVVCNAATKKYGIHCGTVVAVFVCVQSVLTRLAAARGHGLF
jgi:hypothetical protein